VSARVAKPVKGVRRLERWFVGVMMGIVAFALEKIVLRSVTKKHPEKAETPAASTLTSKGGDVDLDDLHLGKGFGKGR
jgi:hypothetical protein